MKTRNYYGEINIIWFLHFQRKMRNTVDSCSHGFTSSFIHLATTLVTASFTYIFLPHTIWYKISCILSKRFLLIFGIGYLPIFRKCKFFRSSVMTLYQHQNVFHFCITLLLPKEESSPSFLISIFYVERIHTLQ